MAVDIGECRLADGQLVGYVVWQRTADVIATHRIYPTIDEAWRGGNHGERPACSPADAMAVLSWECGPTALRVWINRESMAITDDGSVFDPNDPMDFGNYCHVDEEPSPPYVRAR